MNEPKRLCDVKVNEYAVVSKLEADGSMRRRLIDIGLIDGTVVKCIGRSPLNDPSAYLIRGAVIALRREDARKITVIGGENIGTDK